VRSVENILDELELLHKTQGAESVYFEDSLFYTSRKWFERFCEEYKMRGLHKKIQWGFETRIDTIDFDQLKLAKESGCIYTFFGVESGSEIVLKKANKPYSKDAIIAKIFAAKQAGIAEVKASIILGLPYETKETINETLSLLKILPCDGASIHILDIYPGTEAAAMLAKGEGGLRWVKGKEMSWEHFSRRDAMVEVNDLSEHDLLEARANAIQIMLEKSKGKRISHLLKMWAFSKELLRNDPKRFFRSALRKLARMS